MRKAQKTETKATIRTSDIVGSVEHIIIFDRDCKQNETPCQQARKTLTADYIPYFFCELSLNNKLFAISVTHDKLKPSCENTDIL